MAGDRRAVNILREAREAKGRSLRSAAKELGVDPSYLSRVETGERSLSARLRERAESIYGIDSEMLALSAGHVPPDILEILRQDPALLEEIRTRSVHMAHPDDLLKSDDARIAVAEFHELERLLAQNLLDPVAIRDLLEEPSGLYQKFYRLWSDMQVMAQSPDCKDQWLAGQAEAQLRHGAKTLLKVLDHAIAKVGPAPALPSEDDAKSVLMENFDRWSGQNGLSIRIEKAARRFLDS